MDYALYMIALTLLGISFFKNKMKTKQALKKAWKAFENILPAENPHGKDHGLFVGYAPADNPNLVVVAVIDQGGFGSVSAAPIVQRIFEYVFPPKQPAIVSNKKKS